ncbi:uncharacterized protein LOC132940952 isoform X2 [Metopolophium dirhodum]|nr:uncharacterized protein LOC132940952 isoform X2 [Metopolophium dirhodum]XP_060864747.1 uncharacterized protein LOC132940952 isoform X2 [Metopolophium dirhodum]
MATANNLDYYDSDDQEEDDTDAEYDNSPSPKTKSGDSCCTNKCLLMFDDEFKTRFKSDMSLLQKFEKSIYLFAMISIDRNKINATKIIKSSKCFQYAVKHHGVNQTVCKSAFVILHDTTPSLVRTLCVKMTVGHNTPVDGRGKHSNRLAISDETQVAIKEHFFSILKSPNIFKCAKKNLGQPNISQLWISFKQKHGHISRSTYTKYIQSLLTPEVVSSFMCANQAKQILQYINKNKSR